MSEPAYQFEFEWNGVRLQLCSQPTLFSPRRADVGTVAMLKSVDLQPGQRVLDLGCGCGLVGIYSAGIVGPGNVVMTDVDPCAVNTATENAEKNGHSELTAICSDGFRGHTETDFDWILSNPPYHEDFSVAKHFILKGFNRLVVGGRLVFVVKRDHWYRKKLASVFGGCRTVERDGYRILIAEKRSESYSKRRR